MFVRRFRVQKLLTLATASQFTVVIIQLYITLVLSARYYYYDFNTNLPYSSRSQHCGTTKIALWKHDHRR